MTPQSPIQTSPTKQKPKLRRTATQTLPMTFLSRAATLPGKTLAVAVALSSLADLARSPKVTLGRWALARFSISPDATFDALTRLAEAGLVNADRRRGRRPIVVLLDGEGRELKLEGWR